MYQQARRIGELTTTTTRGTTSSSSSFKDLATAQCQSYLAATNALSLVEKSNAWVAVVAGDHHENFERVSLSFFLSFLSFSFFFLAHQTDQNYYRFTLHSLTGQQT